MAYKYFGSSPTGHSPAVREPVRHLKPRYIHCRRGINGAWSVKWINPTKGYMIQPQGGGKDEAVLAYGVLGPYRALTSPLPIRSLPHETRGGTGL